MKLLRSASIALALSALSLPASAEWKTERTLASPDGRVKLLLERDDSSGQLAWSVTRAGRPVVTRGALGLEITGKGVVAGAGTIADAQARSVDTTWTPPYGERATVSDRFNEETWTLAHPDHGALKVRVQARVYNEGAALRYLIDGDGTLEASSEMTSFPLPESAQVWTSGKAQGVFTKSAIGAAGNDLERPLTAEIEPGLFAAFGEAGLRDHARMKFSRTGASTLVPRLSGSSTATGSMITPWRYVRVAGSPAELIQGNDFMLNLNEPSEIGDASWLRPGKVLRDPTLTTQGGMATVDWAAKHGLDFVVFDAGWYGPEANEASDAATPTVDPKRSPGPLDIEKVIRHAKTKGIGVILYVNHRALKNQLDSLLPLYKQWGVAGIKFGYVNVGSQQWTRWLHDAIAKCAKYGLMVDVHDEYRMTGVQRTLPNFMTAEGIRGDEETPPNELVLQTIFTRGLAGAADQTNCYFAPRVPTMGSHASQLAKSVCIYSPWQFLFWYDRPPEAPGVGGAGGPVKGPVSLLQDVPELTFFKRLPTVWDDTRWLDGHPDSHATVARRKGDVWFIGALNGAAGRAFRIPLDFLPANRKYTLELFSDDASASTPTKVRIDVSEVTRDSVIEREVAARNGLAAILTPSDSP